MQSSIEDNPNHLQGKKRQNNILHVVRMDQTEVRILISLKTLKSANEHQL